MFNLGLSEVIVIGVVALIVIGPKQLPEVAKVIGRLLAELRRATQDLSGGLLEVKKEVEASVQDVRSEVMKAGHDFSQSVLNTDSLSTDVGAHGEEASPPDSETPGLAGKTGGSNHDQ